MEGLPANVSEVISAARTLPEVAPGIVGIALVGSWARAAGRGDSDVDLIVLTAEPPALLDDRSWFAAFGKDAVLVGERNFGLVQERRLRRPDGLEVEVGVASPAWAAVPPDAGTSQVVRDGLHVLFDPEHLLADLARAVQ